MPIGNSLPLNKSVGFTPGGCSASFLSAQRAFFSARQSSTSEPESATAEDPTANGDNGRSFLSFCAGGGGGKLLTFGCVGYFGDGGSSPCLIPISGAARSDPRSLSSVSPKSRLRLCSLSAFSAFSALARSRALVSFSCLSCSRPSKVMRSNHRRNSGTKRGWIHQATNLNFPASLESRPLRSLISLWYLGLGMMKNQPQTV
mmetsp:Transcript_112686/g.177305  ORF Transcript_112686/g.177305 Transcript_112686/m.177305 type:complete len:202 (+) Transcript_112686:1427-2032(+)